MSESDRVPTGIAKFDAMIGGGFVPESAILLRGAPGTGKTTFGLQYLLEGAHRGEAGMFVSFEEFPQSLYRDAASLGWDLKAYEEAGTLRLLFTSPHVLMQSLATPESKLLRTLHDHDITRVVVDSLTHFTQVVTDDHELRRIYHQVTSAFRREGVTVLYLGEEMRSDFTNQERGRLSFVVDSLILLRYLEIDSAIQRGIVVLKMRSSAHDTAIYNYTIGPEGIVIGNPIEGRSGLLSGLAEHRLISTVQ
jgi:circadian clock protein KaiC